MHSSLRNVIVIGSGLSAYGSILALINQKIRITVLDVGNILPNQLSHEVKRIKEGDSSDVYREILKVSNSLNHVKLHKSEMPKKTVFGSQYFYQEEVLNDSHKLPYSEAFGGYSVAWGAAVLPPHQDDINSKSFPFDDLIEAIKSISSFIDLPHIEDQLSPHFPNYGVNISNSGVLLSGAQSRLLRLMEKTQETNSRATCVVGRARLLTSSSGSNACTYCGMCSHGCAFTSIFSTEDKIKQLIEDGKLTYLPQRKVGSLLERDGKVHISVRNLENGSDEVFEADQVFVAAGAVNSTKIAIKSFGLENEEVIFQKTGGFVRPYFSIKKLGFDWPKQNTQANIFMEIKDYRVSKYWIHSQISTPNEIVVLGLGHLHQRGVQKLLKPLRIFLLSHLVLVMTNTNSLQGPYYKLKSRYVDGDLRFFGDLVIPKKYLRFEHQVERLIKKKLFKIGLLPLPFTRKGVTNGPGYHIGGSIPIGGDNRLSTNSLGKISKDSHISFVDTSTLPSIPGTTIGLFAMANSYRITKKVISLRANG